MTAQILPACEADEVVLDDVAPAVPASETYLCGFCGDTFPLDDAEPCPDSDHFDLHCPDCWTDCRRCVAARRAA